MPRVRHGFWTLHQADSADSDSGRYFSGAAKGEWCQPENVDSFSSFFMFLIFENLNIVFLCFSVFFYQIFIKFFLSLSPMKL